VALDAPFLGLHPGIIVSGIASLFRKAPEPKDVDEAIAESGAASVASDPSAPLSPDLSLYNSLSTTSGVTSPTLPSAESSSQIAADPYFNPKFANDVLFIDRGWWKNMAHFANKHKSEGVFSAARSHIMNHLEFGACLADYVKLNQRYDRLRHLEDVDDFDQSAGRGGPRGRRKEARVRFVNYFTLSTGRSKSPESKSPSRTRGQSSEIIRQGSGIHLRPEAIAARGSQRSSLDQESRSTTPAISIADYSDSESILVLQEIPPEPMPPPYSEGREPSESHSELQDIIEDPSDGRGESPTEPNEEAVIQETDKSNDKSQDTRQQTEQRPSTEQSSSRDRANSGIELPPIPDPPEPPVLPNLDIYTDKDARKQAEKETKRLQKAYEVAVKNREKAIKERRKLVEKQEKKAQKAAEKIAKEQEKKRKQEDQARKKEEVAAQNEVLTHEEKERKRLQEEEARMRREEARMRGEVEELDRRLLEQQANQEGQVVEEKKPAAPAGKKKERKFCTLPRKVNGQRDPCWIEVYMEGVDEVGAHCGLFFAGPQYERLVGDVGSRIMHWVQEDASKRVILELG